MEKHPDVFPKKRFLFLEKETAFAKLLALPTLSDEERGDILIERALSYQLQERLNPEETKHLLAAALWSSVFPPNPIIIQSKNEETQLPNIKMQKINRLEFLLSRFRSDVRSSLETPNVDSILNELVQTIRPDMGDCIWNASPYPRFTSKDGSIGIDVLEGTLFERGLSLRSLPWRLKNNPLVVSVCEKEEKLLGSEIEQGVWEFSNKNKEEYRLVNEKNLYRKFDGSWAKKVAPPVRLPLPLLEKCSFWMQGDRVALITDKDRVLARIDITQLPAASSLEKILRESSIQKIEKNKETGYFLENLLRAKGYDTLERFAGKENVLIWKKKDAPAFVEIPHLDLSFRSVEKEGTISLLCNEIKGFRIAEQQEVPVLGKIECSLVLEGKDGKKAILIPNGKLQRTGGGSLAPLYTLEKPNEEPKFFRYLFNEKGE